MAAFGAFQFLQVAVNFDDFLAAGLAVQTIDVAQMFNTRRINAKVVDVVKARFPAIFEREARYYTGKFGGASR